MPKRLIFCVFLSGIVAVMNGWHGGARQSFISNSMESTCELKKKTFKPRYNAHVPDSRWLIPSSDKAGCPPAPAFQLSPQKQEVTQEGDRMAIEPARGPRAPKPPTELSGSAKRPLSNTPILPKIADLQSQDPVEGNPFAANDPRYEVWKGATLTAEEELHRLNSQFFEVGSLTEDMVRVDGRSLSLAVAKFDIWSKRGIQVVWDDQALHDYDQWLSLYANGWLKAFEPRLRNRLPFFGIELHRSLLSRVEHWRAEARRYRAEQLSQPVIAAKLPQTGRNDPDTVATDSKTSDRRAQVEAYIEEVRIKTGHNITKADIWKMARYKSRTEFERWERNDPKRPNRAANERFSKILSEKPHLK